MQIVKFVIFFSIYFAIFLRKSSRALKGFALTLSKNPSKAFLLSLVIVSTIFFIENVAAKLGVNAERIYQTFTEQSDVMFQKLNRVSL